MIHARDFVDAARARGFDFYAGVPCSFLTPFINYVIGDATLDYVSAANEGDAVAIAAGATLGGRRGVAMMQNSGLGNAVSPLTSLTWTFRIPILVVCTHRGAPGVADEPQHELMGTITERLFETMDVPWLGFPREVAAIAPALDAVDAHAADSARPHALIMQKGTCEPFALAAQPPAPVPARVTIGGSGHGRAPAARLSRHAVLSRLVAGTDAATTVVIATTGFTGRELYAIDDRPNQLYMVGSMGCAASLGLGLALARPDLRVVVADGDGAALMRMGNLATVGAYAPPNLVHLLLDNEAHDSTGAQGTVSAHTDFAAIAAACGYRSVLRGDELDDVDAVLATPAGPAFLHQKICTGTLDDLPRPKITPPQVLERLMRHIGTR
ncbi:MAG: phosphonopyruvate decarboxylase [Gammaproteobacteria bacterium]|nr:phosphonopyruvate decarboxylase [Gammaproteobacteria bacterium]